MKLDCYGACVNVPRVDPLYALSPGIDIQVNSIGEGNHILPCMVVKCLHLSVGDPSWGYLARGYRHHKKCWAPQVVEVFRTNWAEAVRVRVRVRVFFCSHFG
jgi:hypothetical protein